MKLINIKTVAHYAWSHRSILLSVALTALGLFLGTMWFTRNLGLSPYGRGVMCCDASRYLWLSSIEISQLIYHVHERTFGYPLFLAIFRRLTSSYPQGFFLAPALITQFALSILGSTLLFLGIRQTGLKLPFLCYALLLAHPALAGIAAVPLTDSLGCSLASMFIGIVALLCCSQRLLWVKCLALGVIASIMLSVRPPSTSFMLIWTALVFGLVGWGAFIKTRRFTETILPLLISAVMYTIGFIPVGGLLLNNCYALHKQICVIDRALGSAALSSSLNMNYQYSRAWGTVDPVKSWEWRFTPDQILENCSFSVHTPLDSLITCYRNNLLRIPKHLFHRTIGLFDYRHLNPYAALETSNNEFWILRIFAAIGLVGLIACILLTLSILCHGTIYRHGYLLLPLSCFAVQVNLHTENRYLLSAIPCFFLVGSASLCCNPFKNKWTHNACIFISILVLAYAFLQVGRWDEMALQLFGSR